MAVVVGIVIGIFTATTYHFGHEHTGHTPDELVWHFLPELIMVVTICAVSSGLAAATRNRLKRKA